MARTKGFKPRKGATRAAQRRAAETRAGLIYHALPSDGKMTVRLKDDGLPQMVYPSRISLTQKMRDRLDRKGESYWFPRPDPIASFAPKWIVNMLADADIYPHGLQALDAFLKEHPVPVFNHPLGVLKSRRDYVWSQLRGIPHLVTPKCVRFFANSPNAFLRAFDKAGFSFPVLLRPIGSHTGTDLIRIDSNEDWPKIFSIPWGGREMYMTQWVDFRSERGDWCSLRLCLTPDKVFLRRALFSDTWLIHIAERTEPEVDRELDLIEKAEDWPALLAVGAAIRERLGLQYCGVDLGCRSDTEFVLFEANPSMNIVTSVVSEQYRRLEYEARVKMIERELWHQLDRFIQTAEAQAQ